MSLVTGRGPLSKDPAGWFSPPLADGMVLVEPHPRRIQALRDDLAVIDTERARFVHRAGRPLSYAFPVDEVSCLPGEPVAEAPGFVQVPWDAVDTWMEEGRRLVHSRRTRITGSTAGRRTVGCGSWSARRPGRHLRHDDRLRNRA